ncbi:winged helix-turn-helix transcriptional regulator [Amycolatopsis sp. K13G38]|uniref:Winged helix-turn-helix transcriptional regulator n=1 Tax=Amycolatopsis acididurans TaxID=2724524 RepID=A0ABX1JBI9_9PSEU|nr:winged helix-turn-helix domain-containing protein [Amycolatopsis acididurans]NKQ57123.1 winged helix-turn-helix transcriptional regulator [Amycolatopsis acididurans]
MELDPDDPRPPYQQVANALRAAILTKTFQPGEKLPSGPELSQRFGVARMTVQQAIRLLRDEGLVVSRQGSGVYVRERTQRPVDLRSHLERAFEEPEVSVDFAGFSGETLHGAITEPLDKIRDGRLRPESLSVRLLVPDPRQPWTLPARVDDLADSPPFRARAARIMQRHTLAVVDTVNELADLGLVPNARAQVRINPAVPLFKLYLLNDADVFFGYYPVQEHKLRLDGEETAIWDLMGKDATLFHHAADSDEDSVASQYLRQSRMWFDSVWSTVARDFQQ